MARYDIRDLLGHWVKPRRREAGMCPHACCRNRRPHPDRFPVLLSRQLLRDMSEADIYAHYQKHAGGPQGGQLGDRVEAELTRRERIARNRAARAERARGRRGAADSEFRAHLENEWVKAEAATNGYMVNRAGQRAGIDPRSLFTGPHSRVKKYASPELRAYFDQHPRLSRSEFTGGEAAQLAGGRRRRETHLYGVYSNAAAAALVAALGYGSTIGQGLVTTVIGGLFLAVTGGAVRLALIVRETSRSTRDLTRQVDRLNNRMDRWEARHEPRQPGRPWDGPRYTEGWPRE